ncbi:MAG: NnrU family protein [Pseudomonadota bacterium]
MVGWLLLILGLALWAGIHLFKRISPERRAKFGDPFKGVVALTLVVSIVLMVLGYRATPVVNVWQPPGFFTHINNLLVLVAIYMMSPAPKRGAVLNERRHPMLTGFKLWAFAHLLVNGDLASILLFGGLLAWAVVSVIMINRAEPSWTPRPSGSLPMDGVFLLGSAVLLGVIGFVHNWLGVWPFG